MKNVGLRALVGSSLAIAMVAAWTGPVAAVDAADYVVWQWAAPGARGLGLIKTGPGTLQLEVIGLAADKTHNLVLSSAGCGKQSKPSNTISTHAFNADANGAAYLQLELENTLVSIRSARLFKGSTQQDCGPITGYAQGSGDPIPVEQISFNFYNRNGLHFAVMIEVENDETHWVGHDFMASEEYRLVATNARCPNQPNSIIIEDLVISVVKGTIYEEQSNSDIAPGVIRSFQVFHGSTRVACGKAINAAGLN